jgi:AraC-like DNA-binding protein
MAIIAAMHAEATGRPRGLCDSRIVDDVDGLALLMADGLRGEYVKLESKPFRVRWTSVGLDSMVAQFGSEEVAVVRRMRVPADRWAFMIPLDVPDGARWNGLPVRPEDIVICPGRSEFVAFDPARTRFALLTVPSLSEVVEAALPLMVAHAPKPVAATCGNEGERLHGLLTGLRDQVESARLVRSAVRNQIANVLTNCLRLTAARSKELASSGSCSRIVGLAEEFFRRHIGEGVSVAQLSSVAGVSERSLRNAFYDVYTTSPKRYMKLWQLHQVRRALRASARSATVTDVATGHGFYELGRFAGAYKSLFGETPSETLTHAKRIRGAA